MISIENECVDCGLPCIGNACPYTHVKRYYCDECEEVSHLYEFDGEELCLDCIKKRLIEVK